MAKKTGLGQSFYIGGKDISGDVSAMDNVSSPKEVLDVTGIDKSAIERIAGRGSGEVSFTTFFNDAANQQHAALKSVSRTDVVACYFQSSTLGETAAGIVAKQMNYDTTRGTDGSLTNSVQLLANSNVLEWGNTVTAGKITQSSAGSTTGIVTASSPAGGAAYIQIFSLSSGTPTFVLQDSSDTTNGTDGSWATLLTFATQAVGAERKTVSGTVNKGLRITTTGTFSNAVIAVMFRRGEAVDAEGY